MLQLVILCPISALGAGGGVNEWLFYLKQKVAYLHRQMCSHPFPPRFNFVHFHAVIRKICRIISWCNPPPFKVGALASEILDPPLIFSFYFSL